MAERRAATKSRRLGSSRRKQLHEGSSEASTAAPGPSKELPWESQIVQRVQDFFSEQDKEQVGFVTRSDMQKLQVEDFLCSMEELELLFDGLDTAGTGQLSTEEFTAGLRQFLSSQKAARDHHRRKTASRRVRLVPPSPALEGADSEERRHFAAFMDQLGTANVSEEQEIWQLWVKLRQDEPQLLGNLEDFLAKMKHRIQEARNKKEALEVTLKKRVAEHNKEVQQLCEALEQQIHQEQQRLEQESVARSHQHGVELQQALDASEKEVQRLVTAQMELETRCRSLRSTQQAASTENRQLEESNRVLEEHLQHLHQQLQQTHERLQTARAAVAREHEEESGDRAVAEQPGETPMSPQMNPEKSEKYHSETRIRLGSQSSKPKAKSIHHVVWEVPPAEIRVLGAPPRLSSTEEDPFPELLKEEHFSDRSSLLREMNDAIAALSTQLKPQASGPPSTPADTACHPQDGAEPQTGTEATTTHGSIPGVPRETLPGHVSHELFEGDLKEGPAAAELRAPDVTQAGASVGAEHPWEPGAEQGESMEEAQRMLFLQGKGAGVKELMLKVSEHLQGALGESTEAGEQVLMEVEGEGGMREETGWEKAAQPPGEAEEEALSQGENLEAGLGPPEAEVTGLAGGQQLATGELGLAVAPEESLDAGLGQGADPRSELSEKLEIKPGEQLEPEPPSWGETLIGAAQEDGVLPEVTVAAGPGMLEHKRISAEEQPWGEILDDDMMLAPAQCGGSSRGGTEEGEMEVTQSEEMEVTQPGEVKVTQSEEMEVTQPGEVEVTQPREMEVTQPGEVKVTQSEEMEVTQPREMEVTQSEEMEVTQPREMEVTQSEEMEVAHPREAEPQAQGESARGDPAWGGNVGAEVLLPVSVPPTDVQEGGAGTDVTPLETQSSDATIQLLAEVEAALQPPSETLSPGTGQGGKVAPGVQPLEKDEEPELGLGEEMGAAVVHCEGPSPVETPAGSPDLHGLFPVKTQALELVEAEGSQLVTQLHGDVSPETLQEEGDCAALQLREEAEDGGQGQGERELPQEPELDLQGAGVGQREGAGSIVQPWEEAVILDMLENQSTDANVQLLAEEDEIKLIPGGSIEADLQLSSEVGSLDPEQGGNVAPDVPPLDQVDKSELVELEIEDAQADTQLWGGVSPEAPWGGQDGAAVQLREEAEDGGQGQGERELPPDPVLHPHGVTIRQGEGAGAGGQPWGEAVILDMVKDQSTDANVQLLAEEDEIKLIPGGSTEADLQLSSEVGSLDPEQDESVDSDVQLLDQIYKPELVELVEAEDSQRDTQLHGDVSPETRQGAGDHTALQITEEAEDGGQGQGECELPQEPELDPHGVAIRQEEGAGSGGQSWKETVILDMVKDQSTDANVQLLAEEDEIKLTPGGSTEADLQLSSEVSSLDPEQGVSVGPDVPPLDQVDKSEFMELVEAGDSWIDTQLHGDVSPETLQGEGDCVAVQLGEEAEDGGQGQGERELPPDPVLHPHGVTIRQGQGAGAGGQPWGEAVILDTLENQSTDANVQPLIAPEELKSASEGSTEADLAPLGAAGMWEGEQGQSPGSEAGLCAAHTADTWEGAAGAHVSSLAEATLHPICATAGPGLEAVVGALTGPDGQILEETQTLEIPQGERADAGGRPLDGAQGLEVVQGERLEAGVSSAVKTQGLELKQDHENGVFALASLVPEVTLQISTQKLETMMQEDVLVPDMWWLGTSGEAAQSNLLEQVSAQADVRLHAASQQMEEKLLHVRETEQVAAGCAEPPKQEVPPVSTICTGVQQEEDAGNNQLRMVLKGSSLGDATKSTMQLQRPLLGEEREDLDVGHWEKKQEAVQKTSQEGEPSPRELGAVSADGAGAAPRVSPEASLDPDHLYNVLFVGDSHVGKTSFLYRLHADIFNPQLTATVGLDYQVKNFVVDNKRFALRLWDSAGQERYHSITKQFFRKADGVVLMYDITSEYSFSDVQYWLSCIQEGADDRVAILLLGNKTDCAAERRVPTMEGERLAKEHQLMFFECSAASGHNVSESMVSLIRMLKVREDELKKKAEEVPKPPQKKKGCCW